MKLRLSSKLKKNLALLSLFGFYIMSGVALAQKDLGGIAETIIKSFNSVGKLLLAVAYVCGFAFALIAIFKFKTHKDNPQQTPLGIPVSFLCIGMALIFLPTVLGSGGKTLFGTNRTASSFEGANHDIPLSGER